MSAPAPGPSRIHGIGLFARAVHRKGQELCAYTGPVASHPAAPGPDGRVFAMEIEPGRWVDGSGADNPARHANHSCNPSAEMVRRGDRILLVALRDLEPGDEITFDYGYGLSDALAHPCRCGSEGCPGRIVAAPLRPLLRRQLRTRRPTGD